MSARDGAAGEDGVVRIPGARAPDRRREVDARGVRIAVYEWGDATAPPLLLAHGGFDFARTFDVFAPRLADAGWRVVSWDHRGHGDSQHTALYSWEADQRDMLAVLDSTTRVPCPAVGHSKGGALMTQFIQALPHRFTRLAAIDGLPSRSPAPDVAEHERTRLLAEELSSWLDRRRRVATIVRKAGTPDELARRRGRMNPRLSHDWLRYLVSVGAQRDPDGWRWKLDPALRFGGFGPWRSEWSLFRLPGFPVPLLGILGTVSEPMDWGTQPDAVRPYLPRGSRLEVVPDVGHFIHIEKPAAVADLVLEFLSA
ncbi:MAG: alpha/beta hydrolase [Deltaproteobacteria bacterium]|nr:MAG: alpha/beta hydrolase [Deltaproteobacteria bacterium]